MVGRQVEMRTIKELAEAVNISKTSVYNLIKKKNIPKPSLSRGKCHGVSNSRPQDDNFIE
jgi:excisionase family DNA binding protein